MPLLVPAALPAAASRSRLRRYACSASIAARSHDAASPWTEYHPNTPRFPSRSRTAGVFALARRVALTSSSRDGSATIAAVRHRAATVPPTPPPSLLKLSLLLWSSEEQIVGAV